MSDEGGVGGRALRAAGWVIGVVFIGFGLLGMAGGAGLPWLVAGILITPKTREEVLDLCAILARARDRD